LLMVVALLPRHGQQLTNVFRNGLLKHLLKGYWRWQCSEVCAEIPYRFIQDDAKATCRHELIRLLRVDFAQVNLPIGFPKPPLEGEFCVSHRQLVRRRNGITASKIPR